MNFDVIDKDNFLIYATKHCDVSLLENLAEVNKEFRRFMSVKRLVMKFSRTPEKVNIRILLNHIIIITNIFGVEAGRRLLFSYCPPSTHKYLCSLLKFLDMFEECPETDVTEYDSDKLMDKKLLEL